MDSIHGNPTITERLENALYALDEAYEAAVAHVAPGMGDDPTASRIEDAQGMAQEALHLARALRRYVAEYAEADGRSIPSYDLLDLLDGGA